MFQFRRRADVREPPRGYVIDKRYEVVRRIGSGGYGYVMQATQLSLGRQAAVKLMWPADGHDERKIARLQTEVRAVAAIDHPNIVTIYDFGDDRKAGPYVAMRLLRGESLSAHMQRAGKVDVHMIFRVMNAMCAALDAAHGRGIVHRDIKPQNIFLEHSPDDPCGVRVKLLDFGVAYPTGIAPQEVLEAAKGASVSGMMGTPATISPEQIEGKRVQPQTDMYGLGATLFMLLTGRLVFDVTTVEKMLASHLASKPPLVSALAGAKWVPLPLAHLVNEMLAKSPAQRPDSAKAVRERLGALRNDVFNAWAEQMIARPGVSDTQDVTWSKTTSRGVSLSQLAVTGNFSAVGFEQSRVLVIDDEVALLDLVRLALQRAGYLVDTATSGEEGLRRLATQGPYEAVVVDLMMPGIGGIEVIDGARAEGFSGPILLNAQLRDRRLREDVAGRCDVVVIDKVDATHRLADELRALGVAARRR